MSWQRLCHRRRKDKASSRNSGRVRIALESRTDWGRDSAARILVFPVKAPIRPRQMLANPKRSPANSFYPLSHSVKNRVGICSKTSPVYCDA